MRWRSGRKKGSSVKDDGVGGRVVVVPKGSAVGEGERERMWIEELGCGWMYYAGG